jgi:xylulose-5-phosphate/fructose-6-phosphate phosphoketolase
MIDRVPRLQSMSGYPKQVLRDRLIEHRQYVSRCGDDLPEIRDWKWPAR